MAEENLSKEKIERKNVLSHRLFWVLLGINIALLIYLVIEIIMIIAGK